MPVRLSIIHVAYSSTRLIALYSLNSYGAMEKTRRGSPRLRFSKISREEIPKKETRPTLSKTRMAKEVNFEPQA
jgi:hypothetical protein